METVVRWFSRLDASILVVCTANVCRSPMAEGILRAELGQRGLARKVAVASAGTHANQPGRPADPRAVRVCASQGIDLGKSRARQVREEDFARHDFILAMDDSNYRWLLERAPEPARERVTTVASWAPPDQAAHLAGEIPDPYYGNQAGFEEVLARLQSCLGGFVDQLGRDRPDLVK